jgi:ankyrin repeat protein
MGNSMGTMCVCGNGDDNSNKTTTALLDDPNEIFNFAEEGRTSDLAAELDKFPTRLDEKNSSGNTLLQMACCWGHVDTVKMLLRRGANIQVKNYDGWTALHQASFEGHTDIAKLLVEHGAHIPSKNEKGWTPLHLACREGKTDTAKMLIENGADTGVTSDNGLTPLHLACRQGIPINSVRLF